MADYITDAIDLPELVGYVRDSAVLDGDRLDPFLPNVPVENIKQEITRLEVPSLNIAKYRGWNTPAPLGFRPGFSTQVVEIMPLALSLDLDEEQLLQFQLLRSAQPDQAIIDIYDDAKQTALAVQLRIEAARGDLLQDGVVTITENGVNLTADFGVPGTHLVTASTLWSDHDDSTPVTDLKTWEATYKVDNGGRYPDAWLVSTEVMNDLVLNAQIRTLAPVMGTVPGVIGQATVGAVLTSAGVRAPLVIFDGQVVDGDGTATPTLPVRSVVAIRAGMGSTFYGLAPAAATMLGRNLISRQDAPGIVSYPVESVDPASVTTTSEAVALPVLRDPKALWRSTV